MATSSTTGQAPIRVITRLPSPSTPWGLARTSSRNSRKKNQKKKRRQSPCKGPAPQHKNNREEGNHGDRSVNSKFTAGERQRIQDRPPPGAERQETQSGGHHAETGRAAGDCRRQQRWGPDQRSPFD